MPSSKKQSRRIPLAEAIRMMHGVLSRSEFYERYRFDPAIIERLDIRENPAKARSLHCDRRAVTRFIDELVDSHPLAAEPSARVENGDRQRLPSSFGEGLAALARALETGVISQDQFDRAIADLENRSG